MKRLMIAGFLLVGMAGFSFAARRGGYGSGTYGTGSNPKSTYVKPTVTSDGTYRQGHWRTTPNNTESDNYGTKGNYNPYKGTLGTKSWNDND